MEYIKVVILAIIEGITEFLPVSSTGHLILANKFIRLEPSSFENAFNIIIQLGAIMSVVLIYFNKLNPIAKNKIPAEMIVQHGKNMSIRERFKYRDLPTMRLLAKIIVGFLPAALLGFLFDDLIDEYLFNTTTVSIALIFYGIIIIIMERANKGKSFKFESIEEISLKTAVLIGCFQCLAMVPGTSRSAATIIGAMVLGCSRTAAAEFSFFLAIPTMLGATGLKILKLGFGFTIEQWTLIILGSAVSFLIAYLVITKFMGYIKKHDFQVFGIYRIILGIVVLVSLFIK